jgi:N-acetylmuramoyl-L-alanine amidase
MRRKLLRICTLLFFALAAVSLHPSAHASLLIGNRLSSLSKKRPRRPRTLYIVLHTTEGEEAGSLETLVRYGEAHYFVSRTGKVLRIIDKSKIATHAGRSMWKGKTTIDNYSIGIEVSGYHDQEIEDVQYEALRELLKELKNLYRISDADVLTHSMVAYGRPNRFHNDSHRGRKRCGMIFANPEVRARLGLKSQPERDLDVEAGRLKVGDSELFNYLFARSSKPTLVAARGAATITAPGTKEPVPESPIIDSTRSAWQIARERYNDPSTVFVKPDGSRLAGDQVEDWSQLPAGTRVILSDALDTQPFEGFLEIGKDGDTSNAVAGTAYASSTTIYFLPDGLIRTGSELKRHRSTWELLNNPPKGTKVLVGYVYGGHVKTRRPASSIAGVKWNYPSTYYRYTDGSILSGDDIDAKAIPPGTLIFYQQ